MRRAPHENVATALVDPGVLGDLELVLMARDLQLWPVGTAPICPDGPRAAVQVRRRLLDKHRGAWDDAADWTPVWVGFGPSWRDGQEPLPWAAHSAVWDALHSFGDRVRFHRRLGGVPRLPVPHELSGAER